MRLLLVEDDRLIGEALRSALRLEGHAVDWVRDAAAARSALASERFDFVLLDLGLPAGGTPGSPADGDGGLGVLSWLRGRRDATPVIVLTARDGPGDRVTGLDSGADDYLVKPFDLDELSARMRAVQRRHSGRAQTALQHGRVRLDPATRQVTLDGAPLLLSAREFAVLHALMERPGAMLSRAQIEDRLYGWGDAVESNAVPVYIHQLRRKLGSGFIRNVRGLGYCVGDAAGSPRVNSIRNRLLVSLFALLALATLVMGGLTYRNVLAEAETLSDYQLRQMALSLRDQGEIAPAQAGAMADEELEFVIQIWTVDGRVIYATRPHSALPSRAVLGFADIAVAGQTWRTFSVATSGRVIQVAQPRQVRRALAARAAWRGVLPMLLAAPVLLVLAGWLVARALRPLRRVADEVQRRDEQSLAPLPAAELPDEVAPLVNALNTLLARLKHALGTQRAFVADAAHELRSPLTALRLQLQLQGRARDDATRNEATQGLAASIERASRLVEQLLALARNEPGAAATTRATLDLGALVREALADVHTLAAQRGSSVELVPGPPVSVQGDGVALALLVRNLADNALRYSPPGAKVELRVLQEGVHPLLQVDDAGPGIPAEERERVFDRFHRRASGDETGSGLGLAIVRSIAERHGAEVTLADSPLGGLRVTVRFAPAVAGPRV